MNRALIRPILKKTPYELFNNRKPNIAHLHVFGCKCFVLNNGKESLGKFDAKADEGIFLGYSQAFRIYNKRTMTIEESIHVTFDETNITYPRKEFLDDITDSLEDTHNQERNLKRKRDEENKDVQNDTAQENDNLPKESLIESSNIKKDKFFFY